MARRSLRVHFGPMCNSEDSYVELDGERVRNCSAVSIHGGVDQLTSVTLTLVNVEVDLVADRVEDENITGLVDTTAIGSTTKNYARINHEDIVVNALRRATKRSGVITGVRVQQ